MRQCIGNLNVGECPHHPFSCRHTKEAALRAGAITVLAKSLEFGPNCGATTAAAHALYILCWGDPDTQLLACAANCVVPLVKARAVPGMRRVCFCSAATCQSACAGETQAHSCSLCRADGHGAHGAWQATCVLCCYSLC
jgi:hypothetical protein